jgi:hypothetical protein
MMNKLRSRSAYWHTLAKFIPSLYKLNYTAALIDEASGITPAEQSRWSIAATVYDSLAMSGKVPSDILSTFDKDGDTLLYPFRCEENVVPFQVRRML